MQNESSVRPLRILSSGDAWRHFGDLTSEAFLRDMHEEPWSNSCTYEKQRTSNEVRDLPRMLSELVTTYAAGILCITHWWSDTASFDQFRRSLGESRSLKEAPVHIFSRKNRAQVEELLGLILLLDWDCFISDPSLRYLIDISHNGYVRVDSSEAEFFKRVVVCLDRIKTGPDSESQYE